MKRKIFILLNLLYPIFVLNSLSSGDVEDVEDPFLSKRTLWEERLLGASVWLVEHGLNYYQANGADALGDKLHNDFRVAQYIPAYTSINHDYTAFGITLGGTFFDVSCFYREKYDGDLYELWTIQSSYDSVYDKNDSTIFLYAKSDCFYCVREIECRTDELKTEYKFKNGYTFDVPLGNKIIIDKILKITERQKRDADSPKSEED